MRNERNYSICTAVLRHQWSVVRCLCCSLVTVEDVLLTNTATWKVNVIINCSPIWLVLPTFQWHQQKLVCSDQVFFFPPQILWPTRPAATTQKFIIKWHEKWLANKVSWVKQVKWGNRGSLQPCFQALTPYTLLPHKEGGGGGGGGGGGAWERG